MKLPRLTFLHLAVGAAALPTLWRIGLAQITSIGCLGGSEGARGMRAAKKLTLAAAALIAAD
jgi:hypothetical protein